MNGAYPVPGYLAENGCRLADLIDLVSEKTDLAVDDRERYRGVRGRVFIPGESGI